MGFDRYGIVILFLILLVDSRACSRMDVLDVDDHDVLQSLATKPVGMQHRFDGEESSDIADNVQDSEDPLEFRAVELEDRGPSASEGRGSKSGFRKWKIQRARSRLRKRLQQMRRRNSRKRIQVRLKYGRRSLPEVDSRPTSSTVSQFDSNL